MKKCIVMFVLLVMALFIAVYSDGGEIEVSEKDTVLEQSIYNSDLAHQTEKDVEIGDGGSSYVQVADSQ